MRFALLALLAASAVASPSNIRVQLQEVFITDTVAPDNHIQSDNGHSAQGLNAFHDMGSPIMTTINPLTNTKQVCFWSGTAPFCAGECPVDWTTDKSDNCGDGKCCTTGIKRKCCRTFNLDNCYWSGTAPFCDGGCDPLNETEASRDNCGDGKCCGTGSKAKCCKPL